MFSNTVQFKCTSIYFLFLFTFWVQYVTIFFLKKLVLKKLKFDRLFSPLCYFLVIFFLLSLLLSSFLVFYPLFSSSVLFCFFMSPFVFLCPLLFSAIISVISSHGNIFLYLWNYYCHIFLGMQQLTLWTSLKLPLYKYNDTISTFSKGKI